MTPDYKSRFIELAPFVEFMKEAHKDQLDKALKPYYLHPIQVKDNVINYLTRHEIYHKLSKESQEHLMNRACIVAICHDLIEDTHTTYEQLEKLGADSYICNAICKCTHKQNYTYEQYIDDISTNVISTLVKIADLQHNMDITRFAGVCELDKSDIKRLNKYLKAYTKLTKKFDDWMTDYVEFDRLSLSSET